MDGWLNQVWRNVSDSCALYQNWSLFYVDVNEKNHFCLLQPANWNQSMIKPTFPLVFADDWPSRTSNYCRSEVYWINWDKIYAWCNEDRLLIHLNQWREPLFRPMSCFPPLSFRSAQSSNGRFPRIN